MSNLITDTTEIAEGNWNPDEEPGEFGENLAATREPEGKNIEFHISMQGHTMRAMEDLIVEAAARQMLGAYRDRDLAKQIQDRAVQLISGKIDKALEPISAEIINQPMINTTFAPTKGDPVTLKEFIGLCGRDFLTQYVDRDGNPTTYDRWNNAERRVEKIVRKLIDSTFKKQVEEQTISLITEVRNALRQQMATFVEAEKARLREALAYEVKEAKR